MATPGLCNYRMDVMEKKEPSLEHDVSVETVSNKTNDNSEWII